MTGKSQKGAVRRRLQLQSGWLCSSRSGEAAGAFKEDFHDCVRWIASQDAFEMINGTKEVARLVERLPCLEVRQRALL